MQHYILIKQKPRPKLPPGLADGPLKDWQRKARALRMRREQLLKQRFRKENDGE